MKKNLNKVIDLELKLAYTNLMKLNDTHYHLKRIKKQDNEKYCGGHCGK